MLYCLPDLLSSPNSRDGSIPSEAGAEEALTAVTETTLFPDFPSRDDVPEGTNFIDSRPLLPVEAARSWLKLAAAGAARAPGVTIRDTDKHSPDTEMLTLTACSRGAVVFLDLGMSLDLGTAVGAGSREKMMSEGVFERATLDPRGADSVWLLTDAVVAEISNVWEEDDTVTVLTAMAA